MSFRKAVTFLSLTTCVALAACSTSPTGRNQILLYSEGEMTTLGAQSFDALKEKEKISTDTKLTAYVNCVANHVTTALGPVAGVNAWEVKVFDSTAVNAFALPGGKIGVYTGILNVANTQEQLAAIIGHEVGHVIANHGNERVSQSTVANTGLQITSVALGSDIPAKKELMGALGTGVQYGILMPYGRAHESEADLIGLELMAKAGFNPKASVTLWENMSKASDGNAPHEMLSTHPSNKTRISDLNANMDKAMTLYRAAQQQGKQPHCQR